MTPYDELLKQENQDTQPYKLAWWQVKERQQRQEAYSLLNNAFEQFSQGTGDVAGFLDTYGRFDRYSPQNALLIHVQSPHASKIGDHKYWQSQGVEILKSEKREPILILEPGKAYQREDGSLGQSFYAKEMYDISQTTAQPQPAVAWDERQLLKALIHRSPVSIQVVEQLPEGGHGAQYVPDQNAILVQKGMDAPGIFRSVSLELAKAQLAAQESPDPQGWKSFCVSYILCKKYGVDTRAFDTSRVDQMFAGKSPGDIKADLRDMENAMGCINSRMAKVLYPQHEKNHPGRKYEAR